MKIELKLNNEAIMLLASKIEGYAKLTVADFEKLKTDAKIIASVMIEIADLALKKRVSLERTTNLFEQSKKHNFKLKYYQADALRSCIAAYLITEDNDFNIAVLSKTYAQLDEKMQ